MRVFVIGYLDETSSFSVNLTAFSKDVHFRKDQLLSVCIECLMVD
jgi:hypothetical protein